MVITNLIGGLGNQMFEYAAGRALSLHRGVSLKLDVSRFADYELHQGFELKRVFNCTAEIASKAEVRSILGWQYSPIAKRFLSRQSLKMLRRKEFVIEPHFQYWKGIENAPSDCYLMGYWQSERYFSDVAAQIRKEFHFRIPLLKHNNELASQIGSVNAVSLHVRRGDYVQNAKTNATHGLCSIDYYQAAIRHVAARTKQPHFFIFSDDIPWVKNNFKLDFPHQYVDHNHDAESYNDMRMMSACKHHIIANSSFSWWGAWLNPDTEKIVIAPKKWFANKINTQDLYPKGWIVL